jgi:hypothetical protein
VLRFAALIDARFDSGITASILEIKIKGSYFVPVWEMTALQDLNTVSRSFMPIWPGAM